jgi:hypothetical protein
VELASHLPALLPGLLGMLSDGNAEIRSACTKLLQVRRWQRRPPADSPGLCRHAATAAFTACSAAGFATHLLAQAVHPPPSCRCPLSHRPTACLPACPQEFLLEVQTAGGGANVGALAPMLAHQLAERRGDAPAALTVLRWLHALVGLAPGALLRHAAALLPEVLPCLGHEDSEIAGAARQLNADLLGQVQAAAAAQRNGTAAAPPLDSRALLAAVR